MSFRNKSVIELNEAGYVPVIKDATVYYGGSQMWFPNDRTRSKDYILHNYGCGTIATADLFLYLAIRKDAYRNAVTESVLQGTDSAYYKDYLAYVRKINEYYTKTRRYIAVLGPQVAISFNSYARTYQLKHRAKWKLTLTYYDMLEQIEEMLSRDIPVILSIGPNTPAIWGKKGISFYQRYTKDTPIDGEAAKPVSLAGAYHYKAVKHDINSHYVTVTGMYKDASAARIMLRISSWGKPFYIDYEEYREYIHEHGGTYTSSIVYIR